MAYSRTHKLTVEVNILVRGRHPDGEELPLLNETHKEELEQLITAYIGEQEGLESAMVEVV